MHIKLGVNIDHVATLRQLRGTPYPNLLEAARLAEAGGADQITIHLREDRRHIQDEDVYLLRKEISVPLNLEMAVTPEMVRIASKVKPAWVCLVPEKRHEVTTEGGLDVKKGKKKIQAAVSALQKKGIRVSLFVEPSVESMEMAHELGADAVELHTGQYCLAAQGEFGARSAAREKKELARMEKAGRLARELGLHVHAGHGFDYENIRPVLRLRDSRGDILFEEYNIGHVLVCRAVVVGLQRAVQEMKDLLI